ncbi:oligosaccharide flippase family protein [bacterium]|nr:oligosaccharide flippase family protein [bacterium]
MRELPPDDPDVLVMPAAALRAGRPRRAPRSWAIDIPAEQRGSLLLLVGRGVQLVNGLLLSIVLVQRFGLATVGAFALGIAAVNILATVCALGLGAYLPRQRQSHGQSCFAALLLFLVQLPLVVPLLALYATAQAHDRGEWLVIFVVALSGFFIGLQNLGMMLSIMIRRFHPGLIAPLCETAGLLVGWLWCASAPALALTLLAARVGSVLLIWGGFRLERLPLRRVGAIARDGARWLAPDLLGLLGEQAAPLVLGAVVARGELGVFRLCQQLLMAADSACWTFVQSKYPEMVERGPALVGRVHGQVRRMALGVAAALLVGATVLAYGFFHVPAVAPLMAVLAAALPWRYESYLFGQALRAVGRVDAVTWLGGAKLLVFLLLITAGTCLAGVWGAVVALAGCSVLSGLAYAWAYRRSIAVAAEVPR